MIFLDGDIWFVYALYMERCYYHFYMVILQYPLNCQNDNVVIKL